MHFCPLFHTCTTRQVQTRVSWEFLGIIDKQVVFLLSFFVKDHYLNLPVHIIIYPWYCLFFLTINDLLSPLTNTKFTLKLWHLLKHKVPSSSNILDYCFHLRCEIQNPISWAQNNLNQVHQFIDYRLNLACRYFVWLAQWFLFYFVLFLFGFVL